MNVAQGHNCEFIILLRLLSITWNRHKRKRIKNTTTKNPTKINIQTKNYPPPKKKPNPDYKNEINHTNTQKNNH